MMSHGVLLSCLFEFFYLTGADGKGQKFLFEREEKFEYRKDFMTGKGTSGPWCRRRPPFCKKQHDEKGM